MRKTLIMNGSGSVPFSPSQLSGLVAWFDATQGITKDGSNNVTQWNDLSLNGFNATQAGATCPLWVDASVNGKAAITFTAASSHKMVCNGIAASFSGDDVAFSWYAVIVPATTNSNYFLSVGKSGTNNSYITARQGTTNKLGFQKTDDAGSAISNLAATGNLTSGATGVISIINSGTLVNSYVNSVANHVNLAADVSTTTLNQAAIGCLLRSAATLFYGGKICELVLFTGAHSDANRGSMETFLTSRWIP